MYRREIIKQIGCGIDYLRINPSMINTNDVFRKIKELSKRVPNPRPEIPVHAVAMELSLSQEQILPSIAELKKLRLIQYEASPAHVKLTLLGCTVTR